MKKNKITILLLVLLILFTNSLSYGMKEDKKTVFILVDEIDFETMEDLNTEKFSIGLMNSKARGLYDELNYIMTIAVGRKIKIEEGQFEGLRKQQDGSIKVVGYKEIIKDLDRNYSDFSKKNIPFGEKLKDEGVAYIGEDESSLIACDKEGIIANGETEIVYKNEWLKRKTKSFLKDSNVLILSYNLDDKEERLTVLNNYLKDIENIENYNIILIPKKVPNSMRKIINNSLVPIMYKAPHIKPSILTSESTKRSGIVTNLDVYSHIMSIYDKQQKTDIGKRFKFDSSEDPLTDINIIYKEIINMSLITYIFHGIVYFIQIYFTYFFVKNRRDKYEDIAYFYNFIIITIFVSFILGFFNIHRNILVYLIISLMLSYSICSLIANKKLNGAAIFSTLTYVIMLFGVFFYPKLIYNSYIGYDNLILGARYYGFNNGAMGILLSTSVISYFSIKRYFPNEILEKAVLIIYAVLNILALSSRFGANTGGFFTSIILLLVMLYIIFFDKKFTFKNIVILLLLGFLILYVNLYIDFSSFNRGHAGSLIYRTKVLGGKEVYDIIKIKLKELLKFTLIPPWSIVLISQILFVKSFWNKFKERQNYILEIRPEIRKEYIVLLITGIVAFIINDTGNIAFIYMLQYLLVLFVNISIAKET